MNTTINKQLLINSLIIPYDIQEQIKSFLFLDRITSEARQNKDGLINNLKLGLGYQCDDGEAHWALWYRYEIQFQAINCIRCGGYCSVADENIFIAIPMVAICSCQEFQDEIDENIQPLEIYF